MSKRDRHLSNEAAEERSEPEFDRFEEEEQGRSRFAREAKIGLAVIFVLLVVFGAVVYSRLTEGDEGPKAMAQTNDGDAVPAKTPTSQQSQPAADAWGQPPVVAEKARADNALQKGPSSGRDPWDSGPAQSESRPDETGESTTSSLGVPPAPPAFSRQFVPVTPADRYAADRSGEGAGASSRLWRVEEPENADGVASTPDTSPDADGAESASGRQSTDASLVPAPNLAQASGPSQPGPEQNPLRAGTASQTPAQSPGTSWRSSSGGSAYQGQPGEASVAEAPAQFPIATPRSTFRAMPDVPGAAGQADASSATPIQRNPVQGPPAVLPAPSDTRQSWSTGPAAIARDPAQSSLSGSAPRLGGLSPQQGLGSPVAQNGTYVVQPNDNYWAISQKLYGTGAYFRALAYHNRDKSPSSDQLRLGAEILAPDVAELEKAYPDLCPKAAHREAAQRRAVAANTRSLTGEGRVYVVQEGDNLFDIARYELGKPTRWAEIVDLNRDVLGPNLDDLNYLTPGMKLVLPNDEPSSITQRPGSPYQR